ncbi:MAG: flavoprotein [Candidatus Omnitrophica bacterium]|nr:flavoprotein [Candidatus Omnitrophota bacterium]MDD5430525.1 flavoprotein [Candidatus Omnitrophota bacterium]
MKKALKTKNIIVGVSGGIAAYKTCELVRLLVKKGFSVKVVMTENATKFVGPLVFKELSMNPVHCDMFVSAGDMLVEHVSLAQWANLCIVAPCSANTLSKIASGICDNLLTTLICALEQKTKVLLVPAMNECMWQNPLIQENVKKLKSFNKYILMNPAEGELACGAYGQGRMPEPKDIMSKAISISGK